MEKQTITIYDVAREAGVSMATVSRVVNGNPNVKPDTRQKVNEVIERLDYHPNAVARGLASKKSTTIGVILPDITNPFFASLARGIDDIAEMYKYNIILENSDENVNRKLEVFENLLTKQVDGVIYMGNVIDDRLREAFKNSRTPVVFAGSIDDKQALPSVSIDYKMATEESVDKLIKDGNKHIAFVSGSIEEPVNGKYRLEGYKKALKKGDITYNKKLVFETDYNYDSGVMLASDIAASDATAAFVGNDSLAAGLLNGLQDLDVKVPEEFEIISSNNTEITKMMRPQLSSVGQPMYDTGAVAMRLLTKLMNNEEIEERNIVLPFDMVFRQSTK
ncbi:catabolite control protein A [Pediococcus claussenii]|uniref:Catabolite control protein A n=1 Tax=Pediococcus claussenii (strain ATCC BAA-344 / DSM 14800 / JCM 18046 / KCTC 3811 / LMG 21948 / P06) TaxID=701521 RepID=G8PCP2_PEDCP|nr:catabolite control protein A [Pediococcus claussenii]AEV95027.1 catabolite control protein A [Pediococcus claussenii ATCC BAA-344]ANZ70216.1 catabolite control protein A [Pediococcus claussenii]ANZ72032.1 catabolite control protein A [Pediococcus claussenii]KRN19171.1 ccpA protein [Pediococcus claussenii]